MKKTLILGLAIFTISAPALASLGDADPRNNLCSGDLMGPADTKYDSLGRLVEVNDRVHHVKTELFYDKMAVSLSQTARTGYQSYSAEGGPRELWGPKRWSLYNSKTGRLAIIHTYEDHEARGLQTSFEIPSDHDFSQDPKVNGKPLYTGPYTQETVEYKQVKSGSDRSLSINEPLNIYSAGCINVGGEGYSLRQQVFRDEDLNPAPAPFKSFRTKVITGEGSFNDAPRAGSRFATKVIGGGGNGLSGYSDDGQGSYSTSSAE
jgi:hypothetical protein